MLSAHLRDGLSDIGFKVFSDNFQNYPTGIVVCEKPGVETDTIMQLLKQNNIVAARRLGRVRFSPHVYIAPELLDKVLLVLGQV